MKKKTLFFLSLFLLIVIPFVVWAMKTKRLEIRKKAKEPKFPTSQQEILDNWSDEVYRIYKDTDLSQPIRDLNKRGIANGAARFLNDQAMMHFYYYLRDNNSTDLDKAKYLTRIVIDNYQYWKKLWLSPITMNQLTFNVWEMWSFFEPNLHSDFIKILSEEANFWTWILGEIKNNPRGTTIPEEAGRRRNKNNTSLITTDPLTNDHLYDTRAEENGAIAQFLATAYSMFPNHPKANHWNDAAKCFAFHTLSKGETACGITTRTISNDSILGNHNLWPSPMYTLAAITELQQGQFSYLLAGKTPPSEFLHHLEDGLHSTIWQKNLTECGFTKANYFEITQECHAGDDWGDRNFLIGALMVSHWAKVDSNPAIRREAENLLQEMLEYFYEFHKGQIWAPSRDPVSKIIGDPTHWWKNLEVHTQESAKFYALSNLRNSAFRKLYFPQNLSCQPGQWNSEECQRCKPNGLWNENCTDFGNPNDTSWSEAAWCNCCVNKCPNRVKCWETCQSTPNPTPTITPSPISNPTATPTATPTPTPTKPSEETIMSPKVLYIAFNPVENGKNMAEEFFSRNFNGKSAEEVENLIANETISAFKRLSNNTINYQIAKKINITEFPKYSNGFEYSFEKYRECTSGDPHGTCEKQKWLFDHVNWVRENRICEIADENNVDEIWIISNPFIMTYESFMIGPNNSFHINGGAYNLPECKKHYAVMNANYHIPKAFLHIYGHRIEATMNYLMADWKIEDKQRFWNNFSAVERYREPYGQEKSYDRTYCGNAHFPSNALKHYDYANHNYKNSKCVDWKNFPNLTGKTENINCEAWGCSDNGWQEYWFASLPRGVGEVEIENNKGKKFYFKKNWWYYILYPENSINFKKSRLPTTTPISPTPSLCAICPADKPLKSTGNANCDEEIDLKDFILWLNVYRKVQNGEVVSEDKKAMVDFNCSPSNNQHIVDLQDFGVWLNKYRETL